MYSGNRSNFSSASNLYRPAGVINIQVSNSPQTGNVNGTTIGLINGKGTDGTVVGLPSSSQSSITSTLTQYGTASAALLTNTSYNAQHVDYGQNPSAVNTNQLNYSSTNTSLPTTTTTTTTTSMKTITITYAQTVNPPPMRGGRVNPPDSISFYYSYTAGMTLPAVGSTITTTGIILNGSVSNGYNGTFTVTLTTNPGTITVSSTSPPPLNTPSTIGTGVMSFP